MGQDYAFFDVTLHSVLPVWLARAYCWEEHAEVGDQRGNLFAQAKKIRDVVDADFLKSIPDTPIRFHMAGPLVDVGKLFWIEIKCQDAPFRDVPPYERSWCSDSTGTVVFCWPRIQTSWNDEFTWYLLI